MKRLIILIGLLSTLILAGTANADKSFNPTCGQNAGKGLQSSFGYLNHTGPPSVWTVGWYQNCGTGGTIEYEMQVSSNGGANWSDLDSGLDDYLYTTPGSKANKNTWIYESFAAPSCSNNNWYRMKAYDTNSTAGETEFDGSC